MRPLTLAVCITVLAALVVGSCGCTSLLNKPATPTATASSPPALTQDQLDTFENGMVHDGYAITQHLIANGTAADGSLLYSGQLAKDGINYDYTIIDCIDQPTADSHFSSTVSIVQAMGFSGSYTNPTLWVGTAIGDNVVIGAGVTEVANSAPYVVIYYFGEFGQAIPALQATPTAIATPTPTSSPTQASVSGPTTIVQGQPGTFTATLYSINEHKNVCGAVNYYIDNYAAGGSWTINPAGTCSASSGSLVLAGSDTAALSPGTHTLKIDWLGNSEYGPSQAVMTFTVTPSPTPIPTPARVTISFNGANEISHGAVFELSAIVMQGNTPVTTGTVTFSLAGQTYTATQTDSSGIAGRWTSPQFSPITQVGPYTATASYAGPAGTASTTLQITVT